jgi:hypothetical protein
MKPVAIGVIGTVVALALFFGGFMLGAELMQDTHRGYVQELQARAANAPSAQMQCIHWLENWQSAGQPSGVNGPSFGMYVELCGKPETR